MVREGERTGDRWWTGRSVAAAMGERWRALPEEERGVYEGRAKDLK